MRINFSFPTAFVCLLVAISTQPILSAQSNLDVALLKNVRPIGGSGNNLVHPNLDPVPGSAEINLAPLNFAPHTRNALIAGPNPREISNVIAGGTGAKGQNAETEDPIASAWIYVFGQFVDHDLDLESTPANSAAINITVPPDDPFFPPSTTINMTRDARSRRTNTIINTVAGYLDLSQVYGSTPSVADSLRNPDGSMMTSDSGQALPVVNDVFVAGDPRVMENPELTAVDVLFVREHNWWVATLSHEHPGWSGQQLYDIAKAITTAEYQQIIYKEFLPVLIGNAIRPYRGYNPAVAAQVTQEFSTAAFRLGHSEVSDEQTGLDNAGNVAFVESLAQSFFNTPAIDEANGFDPLLRGISADNAEATDVYTVATLRDLLFAPLVGGDIDEMDLIAIDIQRERDVGLGTLNQTRRALGLSAYSSFAQVTPDPILQNDLQMIYGTVGNLDLFIGGLAERHVAGADVGPTFQAIIARQFQALRDGDRFFWLNQGFDRQTSSLISNTTLATLIRRNTDTTALQAKVFLAPVVSTHGKPSAPTQQVDTHGRRGVPFLIP
jgi:peroxidase